MDRAAMISAAEAAHDAGRLDEAVERYHELERREPSDPTWPSRIAELCRAKKDRPGRVAGLRRAAIAFAASGVPMKALAMAKLAMALDKSNAETRALLEALQRGEVPAVEADESEDLEISVLPPIALFSHLGPEAFEGLLESAELHEIPAGQIVFSKGDAASSMYVIAEGEVEVLLEDGAVARLGSGDFFGEMSLFARAKDGPRRGATVRTSAPTQLLELRLEVLTALIEADPTILSVVLRVFGERLIANVLRHAEPFDALTEPERKALGAKFRPMNVRRGDVLIAQGAPAPSLFILIQGEVDVLRGEEVIAHLGTGALFGEISVMSGLAATASVVTAKKCLLLALEAEAFHAVARDFPVLMRHAAELASQRMG